jgi:hypothetical protein
MVAQPPCHLLIALLQHSTLSCKIITHLGGLRPSRVGAPIPPLPCRDVRHHPLLATPYIPTSRDGIVCSLPTSVTRFFCHSFFEEQAAMSPTCSNAAMRTLISIMLAASVANGAALPHEVLDARDPAAMENAQTAQLAAAAIQQAASDIQNDPDNYFTDMSQELNKKSGWEIFRDFFFRLFAPRPEDNDSDASQTAAAVTIYVTPTPSEGGPASSALEIVIPPGPSATPSVGVVSLIPSVTQAPISEILMSNCYQRDFPHTNLRHRTRVRLSSCRHRDCRTLSHPQRHRRSRINPPYCCFNYWRIPYHPSRHWRTILPSARQLDTHRGHWNCTPP